MPGNSQILKPSQAGIATNPDGSRIVPASVRPDGSLRKEIKVKPGYLPPEDVAKYKTPLGEAFRNRGKGGVPGADYIEESAIGYSPPANKNAKRREARKKAAGGKDENDAPEPPHIRAARQGREKAEQEKAKLEGKSNGVKQEESTNGVDPEVEKQKDARKLAKRLRQAKELSDKKEAGGALLPEQIEKVIKIKELMRQLENLGFDNDGEKLGGSSADKEDVDKDVNITKENVDQELVSSKEEQNEDTSVEPEGEKGAPITAPAPAELPHFKAARQGRERTEQEKVGKGKGSGVNT